MYIIGCDFHTRFQQISCMNTETGEVKEVRLEHSGDEVRKFYESLEKPVRVGIESTGYSMWFDRLLDELAIELEVGDAAEIAARRVKKQKYDKADAKLILKLMVRDEFPKIYWPSVKVRNHRALLSHRHRLVQMRTRVKNSLHAIALSNNKVLGAKLFTQRGMSQLQAIELPKYMGRQREDLLKLLEQLNVWIKELDEEIEKLLSEYPEARRLMTHPGVGALTALAIVLILGLAKRFADGRSVASYLGLVPAEDSSAGHQRFGKLTKQGNKLLRYLMIQAAQSAIKLDPELRRMYYRLWHRKGKQKAKVAVARKLAIRLYIMLRDGIEYEEFCKRGLERTKK